MEITAECLDDILVELYDRLLICTSRNKGTRGANVEILGVALRLLKPRARISRSENRESHSVRWASFSGISAAPIR